MNAPVIALCILFCAPCLFSQILSIQEIDRSGQRTPVQFNNLARPIVDINSTLSVLIDKVAVRAAAGKNVKSAPIPEQERLQTIAQILNEESRLLNLLGPCRGTYEQCREDLRSFSSGMVRLLMYIGQQKSLATRVDSILGLRNIAPESGYGMVFELVRHETSNATEDVKTSTINEKVLFRLGGWLRDQSGALRPIHVPQFDSYAEGQFYEVPRFIIPSAAELQKQYSEAAEAAAAYNKSGKTALDAIGERVTAFYDSLSTAVLSFGEAVKSSVSLSGDIARLELATKQFFDQWSTVLREGKELKSQAAAVWNSSDPMKAASTSFGPILALLQSLKSDLSNLLGLYPPALQAIRSAVEASVRGKLDSLTAIADRYTGSLTSLANDVLLLIRGIQSWIRLDVPAQVEVNLQFSEEVKRILLDDLPDSTEIDLRYTGSREPGDEIYLKAALEYDTATASAPGRSLELERRTLTMFQVDVHAKLAAGVIFLSPFEKSKVSFQKQFQAAPSYSLLAKWGSRSSYVFNTFWSPGVGVSLSAPDFNLDGTPEIAYGLMFATARDYLQLGVGRNIGVDVWFWFFGLQLPIGSVFSPITTAESKH